MCEQKSATYTVFSRNVVASLDSVRLRARLPNFAFSSRTPTSWHALC